METHREHSWARELPFVPWDPCLPSSTLLPASEVVGRGCIKGLSLCLQLPVGLDQRDRRDESIILPVSSLRVFIRLAVSWLLFGIPLGTTSQSSGFNNFSIPCFAEWKQTPGQYCTIPCWFLILWSYPFKQSFYQNFLQLFPPRLSVFGWDSNWYMTFIATNQNFWGRKRRWASLKGI